MGSVLFQLDGTNSFVEFPQGAFTNLHQVTVEGWVRWERFGSMSRFFDFALADHRLDVLNRETSSALWLERIGSGYSDHVMLSNTLSPGRWTHVAAVSGKDGLRLYFNGVLAPTNAERFNISTAGVGRRNYLGRSNWRGIYPDADFQGQIGEVRVWSSERTEAQIRRNMFKSPYKPRAVLGRVVELQRRHGEGFDHERP